MESQYQRELRDYQENENFEYSEIRRQHKEAIKEEAERLERLDTLEAYIDTSKLSENEVNLILDAMKEYAYHCFLHNVF